MHGTRVNYIAPGLVKRIFWNGLILTKSSFVRTGLMSDEVAGSLQSAGVTFGTLEDVAGVLLRLICDKTAIGKHEHLKALQTCLLTHVRPSCWCSS